MKKIYLLLLIFNSVYAQPPGQWMWIHGADTIGSPGNLGVQGVPSPTNMPPALYEPCEWTDLNGNYWLFGGANFTSFGGTYAALWKYEPATNEWTWMKGPTTIDYVGSYGVQGVPSPSNNPPAKSHGTASWVDLQGNLWMGFGIRSNQNFCYSDLWKYDISTNEWTWMKGPNTTNTPGTYGTQGVPSPANNPPPRWESATAWTDNAGNLWLFGGYYFDGVNFISHVYNDLWRYNIATNTWTWMKGSNQYDQTGIYGAQNVEAPANTPGGRYGHCHWKANDGTLWLFSGTNEGTDYFNDLWRYNVATNNWTWMNGNSTPNNAGSYGTMCVAASSNVPGARFESRAAVKDQYGNFWFFAGGTPMARNDLWLYCVATNQWTWISGDNIPNPPGNWGTVNVPSLTNKPSGRIGAVGWRDNSNHLYLFGGMTSTADAFNDLWKFTIDTGGCYPCQILQQPLLITATGDDTICSGDCTGISATALGGNPPFTFSWTPNIGSGPGPHQVCPNVTTTYLVLVTDSAGNTAVDPVTVTVLPSPVADAGADTIICTGESVMLNASGGSTYSWSPITGLSNPNISNPVATPSNTTTYYVTVSSGSCLNTDSVTVTVLPPPIADAGADVVICQGESIQLNASGGNSYSWSPAAGLSNVNVSNPVASPSTTINYIVTVFNGQCYDSDTVNVTVIPAPAVDLGPDIYIDKGTPVILSVNTSATSFMWSPYNSVSCSTCQSVTVTPDTTTTYYVMVTDNNGCINTDSVTVFVGGGEFFVYIPNVFTPNGDLVNNVFYVYGENIKDITMHIFNRWGEMIFESDDITKGWDGKYKDRQAPVGTYVYMVTFTNSEGATELRTGKVSLIR